jgi:hypothetical protein
MVERAGAEANAGTEGGYAGVGPTVRYTELSPTRFKDFWRD